MNKWADQVDGQRRVWREHARNSNNNRQTSTSQTEFTYMRDQGQLVNPYQEYDDGEDDEGDDGASTPGGYGYMGRNDSSSSLGSRARAGTGDSIFAAQNGSRVPPPRFPMLNDISAPALQLQTRTLASAQGGHMSPNERQMDSYFSPTAESPASTRTSSSSANMYGFRQQVVPNGWHPADENTRYTAPAMGRSTPPSSSRNMQRPSLPPHAHSAHPAMGSSRLRSASSPDIQNPIGRPQDQPPVPSLPPFPTHYAYAPSLNNRSNPNLVNQMSLPTRSATQSPSLQRERMPPPRGQMPSAEGPSYYDPRYGAVGARGPLDRAYTSADPRSQLSSSTPSQSLPTPRASQDMATPSQLKVKLHCPSAGSSFTLVVPTNISYQSLKDRIDAKLQRSTNVSLSSGAVKLKYVDDGDYISIQSDEDVQTAFEMWKDQQVGGVVAGQMGEIELYCQ